MSQTVNPDGITIKQICCNLIIYSQLLFGLMFFCHAWLKTKIDRSVFFPRALPLCPRLSDLVSSQAAAAVDARGWEKGHSSCCSCVSCPFSSHCICRSSAQHKMLDSMAKSSITVILYTLPWEAEHGLFDPPGICNQHFMFQYTFFITNFLF